MEFWNSLLTEKSWELLKSLNQKYKFVLIGGWATYLWTKQQKSKDIDIVVEVDELQVLKRENLGKNDKLKKYEIKFDEIDVDIYVSHFSKLAIPVESIKNYSTRIEGFDVVIPEALVILKQGAELDRGHSPKGEKDRIDILSLLFFTKIDFKKYLSILKKCSLENYIDDLIKMVRSFRDYQRFGLTPREFKMRKESILNELKKL